MKVSSVKYVGKKTVYNITMRGDTHNYALANGAVSKNSHATSYGVISYQTAYLKFHYPAEYMAAVLSTVTSDRDRLSVYLNECSDLGIHVLPPSISESGYYFKVRSDSEVLFGLSAIDGIGSAQIGYLKEGDGEYTNLWEFMRQASPYALNKKTIERLVDAGALDMLVRDEDIADIKLNKSDKIDLLIRESKAIGIYLSGHPLNDIWPVMKEIVSHECDELDDISGSVKIGGIISGYKELTTKKSGKKMCKFTLEDLTGRVEVIVFPNVFAKIGHDKAIGNNKVGYVTGYIKGGDGQATTVVCTSFKELDISDSFEGIPIVIDAGASLNISIFKTLYGIINKNPGDSPVYLNINDNDLNVLFKFDISASPEIKESLIDIVSLNAAKYKV